MSITPKTFIVFLSQYNKKSSTPPVSERMLKYISNMTFETIHNIPYDSIISKRKDNIFKRLLKGIGINPKAFSDEKLH